MTTKDNILYFDNCSAVDMANKYGTPLLLISESKITKKANEIRSSFLNKYNNVRAVYASKAFFLNLTMCKFIEREGLGLDVVSGGELFIAKSAGFPMEKVIFFHGNNKSKDELRMAVHSDVGRIVVDNPSELKLLEKICSDLNKSVTILFRITPEVQSDTHAYIATANRDSKFGFPLELVTEQYAYAAKSKNLTPVGLHFHVGSQLQSNTSHLNALDVALKLIEDLYKQDYTVSELNTGGGFGVQYTESDKEMPLEHFTYPIMERIESWSKSSGIERPLVIIEPGRWFIANAGLTLYEIGSTKDIPGVRKYVSVMVVFLTIYDPLYILQNTEPLLPIKWEIQHLKW